MSNPFSDDRGRTAVEPDDGLQLRNAGLLAVLEVGGRLHARVAEALNRVGLTPPGYEILSHLRAGGAIPVDVLGDLLRRPTPEVSPLVDDLTEQGLVRRDADETDGGAVRVTLTPLGSERAREGRTRLDVVLDEFAARVGLEDRLALDRLLAKVAR